MSINPNSGFHDQYGNPVSLDEIESSWTSEEVDETAQDVEDFLFSLPSAQRWALRQRMDGFPLTATERKDLYRAKKAAAKWLESRSK